VEIMEKEGLIAQVTTRKAASFPGQSEGRSSEHGSIPRGITPS
jgi:hypothetical protein